jgi:hypothetical protein
LSRLVLLVVLALGTFLAAHLAGTAVAALGFPAVRRRAAVVSRARLALLLRLLPTAAAALLALLVAVAFARHEPADTGERAGPLLLAASGLGAWLVLAAAWRAIRALVLTRRLVNEWLSGARPFVLPGAGAPAHRIENRFPVVAVVGILRPRLFLAGSVLDRLSPPELRAVLDHEKAHLDRRDNLKRWLVRSCPDLPLLGGPGESLLREWEAASEEAADDIAARRGRRAASSLASALVKVARLSPTGEQLSVSATALLSEGSLRGRVERLLAPGDAAPPPRESRGLSLLVAALVPLAAAGAPRLLLAVHDLLETIVQALS